MHYLITGATGLLGNNLTRLLLESGHQVRALVRPPGQRPELAGLDVEIVEGDLSESDVIGQALNEIDVVVHAAAMIHFGRTRLAESRRINVDATRLIAAAAREKRIRMVHVSSVDALAAGQQDKPADETCIDPAKIECAYVISKREADQVVLEQVDSGLDAVLVYPSLMFGAWDWKPSSGQMILAIANKWVPFGPRGGISAVDVLDVSRGIVQASEKGCSGERYIFSGHNMPYVLLWQKMAELLDRPKPIGRMGPLLAWGVGKTGDLMARVRGKESEVNSAGIGLSNLYHYYHSQKAIEQFGYTISPIEPALERAIEFFRRQGSIKS